MDERLSTHTFNWPQRLCTFLRRLLGDDQARILFDKYRPFLNGDYSTLISPRHAVNDILHVERMLVSGREPISLLKPDRNNPFYRIHFYCLQERYLDEFIPVLENVNLRVLDQVQYTLRLPETVAIKSFTVQPAKAGCCSLQALRENLLTALERMMQGQMENDPLNKLVVLSGMRWQEIEVLRTYRNYLLQIDRKVSSATIHHAFLGNSAVAHLLFDYFEARFRPDPDWSDMVVREEQGLLPLRMALLEQLDAVADISDDRILRTVFNLIDATVRSNFHHRLGQGDFFVAIKINSLGVLEMPPPRPLYEIYFHAADMEAIHLRAGKISRGGIRWSDRVADFRTEILDLMQTQVSKNALIIPTGAKGGFVVKHRNGSAEAFRQAGQAAYVRFIQAMLELTDNYQAGAVVNPQDIVAHDDPDPYLVVAADKGTARFSDIANGIAAQNGFWLADAFASGGSHGYDHKALGITARGAWVCVQRHFLELGKDIQRDSFTVTGIGSMDGDVFGNGMLLSPCIRLKAAFSGQHIFIDPNPPDDDRPLQERQRLFNLPGSSWDDYDRGVIADGGGVFSRSAKDIPVSAEMKKWLGIRSNLIDGDSLIRAILQAPVDLLWLGGIGTYVKASSEKPEEVDDKANENVRIDAIQLKAQVVGEGANLGFTQRARIEYALAGGRINTDAVDNSAGVDTSDHEVNLKISLDLLQKSGVIDTHQAMFDEMTGSICDLVLADNRDQSHCLSLEQRRSADDPDRFLPVADRLEAAGFIDRELDAIPTAKSLQLRPGQRLTRPELAVLMAASKRFLTHHLQEQAALLQDACYEPYFFRYFPTELVTAHKSRLLDHPLANAIKTTVISNKIINQAGCAFLDFAGDNGGSGFLNAVNAYLSFDDIVGADALRQNIIGFKITPERQYQLHLVLENALTSLCAGSLNHGLSLKPEARQLATYRGYWQKYRQFPALRESVNDPLESFDELPETFTAQLRDLANSADFPLAISLADTTGKAFDTVLEKLSALNRALMLDPIKVGMKRLMPRDNWEQDVAAGLQIDLQRLVGCLLKKLVRDDSAGTPDFAVSQPEAWRRYQKIHLQVQNAPALNVLPFVVLLRALADLVNADPH